jgi:hypothetical protein
VIGHIALSFTDLDTHVSAIVRHLLEGDEDWGQLLTEALSFAAKLALLKERVCQLAPRQAFNRGNIDRLVLFTRAARPTSPGGAATRRRAPSHRG